MNVATATTLAAQVRTAAYQWHSGMWSPLYAFASSGIVEDKDALLREIDMCIGMTHDDIGLTHDALRELRTMRDYVRDRLNQHQDDTYRAPWALTYR